MEAVINRTVLMSDTENYEGVVELNVYSDEEIQPNKELARIEHEMYKLALQESGITVVQRKSVEGGQDSVYTANWAYCRRDLAIMARLPNVRKMEEKHAERVLRLLGKRIMYPPSSIERYSGQGDTLQCGDVLFVGSGYRTDPEMADFLQYTYPDLMVVPIQTVPERDEVTGEPVINQVSGWPDSKFYDIDLAMGIVSWPTEDKPGLIAVCKKAFNKESIGRIKEACARKNIEIIWVSKKEAIGAFACNFTSNGLDRVVMSVGAPEFEESLREKVFEPVTCDLSELNLAGGGGRCIGLTLDNI